MRVVASNLVFPEGPRWHDGRLWFSDMHDQRVWALDPVTGHQELIAIIESDPSGLGWTPGGDLLVVSMQDRRLVKVLGSRPGGEVVTVADLSGIATFHCNDMVVDSEGRAYVGNFGFDLHGGAAPMLANIAIVEPHGEVRLGADGFQFPNGAVITADRSTLIVAESGGRRLTAMDLAADGSMSDRRVWADLGRLVPDGICLDPLGNVWIADPIHGGCHLIAEGGAVLASIATPPGRGAFACALGDLDGPTLFMCVAQTGGPSDWIASRDAQILAVPVP